MKAESRPVANGDADPDDLGDAAVIRLSRREPEQFAILFRRHAPQIQRHVVRRPRLESRRRRGREVPAGLQAASPVPACGGGNLAGAGMAASTEVYPRGWRGMTRRQPMLRRSRYISLRWWSRCAAFPQAGAARYAATT